MNEFCFLFKHLLSLSMGLGIFNYVTERNKISNSLRNFCGRPTIPADYTGKKKRI